MLRKPLEVVVPEPLVVRDPVLHRTEPRGDKAIAALSAMPLLRHQTGIKQDAEVLGLDDTSGNARSPFFD
jgi:hypothetical protein